MLGREEELEAFKTRINLTEYAAARGFRPVRRKTYRNSAVMDDGNGTRIIVGRDGDGHYIYFDPLNPRDSGSIVDFELNRNGRDFGQMRKTLRGWLSGGGSFAPPRPAPETYVPELKPVAKDLLQVRVEPEKAVFRPGETGTVRVAVTDAAGKPVSGELTLAAFDKAVTYIQEETDADYNQIMGSIDGLGQLNSWGNWPEQWIGSWHSTNSMLPLTMPVADLVKKDVRAEDPVIVNAAEIEKAVTAALAKLLPSVSLEQLRTA